MWKKNKNRGVLFEPVDDKDYIFGASKIIDNITMSGDWIAYLGRGEKQRIKLETMACVSYSANNCLETIFNYQMDHNMISEGGLQWLEDMGYMEGGEVNLSDRFLAVTSGTTKKGNTGKKVAQAMHEKGCIPESDYPFPDTYSWSEYYKLLEPELFDIAADFNERFLINYETVYERDFEEALKHSPLQVYVHAWEKPVDGIYERTDKTINHAVEMHVSKWEIFDSYEKYDSFVKNLAPDFDFYNIGYKYKLTEIMPETNVKVLKDKNSNTVGYFLPAIDSSAFRSMGANFGISVPLKDGETNWSKVEIDGEYEIT